VSWLEYILLGFKVKLGAAW